MRKDWIRTEEEVRLRQLQKLVKEQKKSTNNEESLLNLPLVARTKKRIKNKSINEDVTVKPVHQVLQMIFLISPRSFRFLDRFLM